MATGRPKAKSVLIDHDLYSPFGMAVVGNELFVANADGLVAFPFTPGQTTIAAKPRVVTALPSGYNHHWTKSLVADPQGRFLYVGVGSNSNVGENGLEMEKGRAAIWQIDPKDRVATRFSRAGFAIRSGWRSTRPAARCGPLSTNATNWATTLSPTTSPRSSTAPFTAGRSAITARTSTPARPPIRDWWPRRLPPITRSARTSPRLA